MKNFFKTSYFFLSFLFFCSITPLENAQSVTNTIQSYLQYYLEPVNPSMPRTVSLLYIPYIMYNFALDEQGLGYSKVLSSNDANDIDKKLFCSFPFISLTIQTVNVLYPDSPFKIFSNFMMLNATDNFFHFLNQIRPNTDDQSLAINLLKSICSLSWPLIAHYNNPDLFATYTYFSVSPIISAYLPDKLSFIPFIVCKRFEENSPIKEINTIFAAKQIMFLVAVVLACFNIKLKNNNILTNPTYWLSVGIAHLLFTHYRFIPIENRGDLYSSGSALLIKTFPFFGITDPTSYKWNALDYLCCNAIPITAVLISAAVPI